MPENREPAPKVLHDLLDAAWRRNDCSVGTGITLRESRNLRRQGYMWVAKVGGDASGFILTTPQDLQDPEAGTFTLGQWYGRYAETGGFLLGEANDA